MITNQNLSSNSSSKTSHVMGVLATVLFCAVIAFAIITIAHFITFKFKHPGESFFANFTRSSIQYPFVDKIDELDLVSSRYGHSLVDLQPTDALPLRDYLDCYYNNEESACLGISLSQTEYRALAYLKKHMRLLDEHERKTIIDTFPKASIDSSYIYVPFENLTSEEIEYYQKHTYDGMIKDNFLLKDNSGRVGSPVSLEFCLANPSACHYIYQYRQDYRRY